MKNLEVDDHYVYTEHYQHISSKDSLQNYRPLQIQTPGKLHTYADFSICLIDCAVTELSKQLPNTGWVNCIHTVKTKEDLLDIPVKHMHHLHYTNLEYYNNIYNWFLSSRLSDRDSYYFTTVQVKTKRFHGIRQNSFQEHFQQLMRIELIWKDMGCPLD